MIAMRLRYWIVVTQILFWSVAVFGHGQADGPAGDSDPVIEFPDTEKYRTLVVDLHTHSVFSDGHVWPVIRVEEALLDGLDGIAITEHLEWQPHLKDIPHPDRNRAFEEAKKAAENRDVIVISGAEITRRMPVGHMNAVFLTNANALLDMTKALSQVSDTNKFYRKSRKWPAQKAVEAANNQGAFVFWNHPNWSSQKPDGIAEITDFHARNAKANLLHGVEIANGFEYSAEAFAIALKHNLTLIGTSDVHDLIDWDYKPHLGGHRPVTLVLSEEKTAESIREALFARRTVVWFKNQLFGRQSELGPLLKASMVARSARWLKKTTILEIEIENKSDAKYLLQNQSNMSFVGASNVLEVLPGSTSVFRVKPGDKQDQLDLEFKVLNALTAPGKPAEITFRFMPADAIR